MYTLVKCGLLLCAAFAASGFELGPQDIVFHLFTINNPTTSEPLLPNLNSLGSSNQFSLERPTVFTVHDYNDDATGNFNSFLIPTSLTRDANVIAVDWGRGAAMYTQGLGNAPQVGKIIAQFINLLRDPFKYDLSLITIVGFGLGGHIAGIAARNVNGDIPYVVAIDPSLKGWTHHPQKLNPDDADLVEVLHATAGDKGYDYPLGDLDFYPNGGTNQTGCTESSCSRIYAYAMYAESLTAEVNNGNKFVGTKCKSYQHAIDLQCDGDRDVVFGGREPKDGASGIYTFRTNPTPPFAQG